jgi:predicted membrane channel-forming protein YqfA (hemolysin III family)
VDAGVRLPNVNELESLVNANEANQSSWLYNQGFLTFIQSQIYYWSSTTFERDTQNAWIVMFDGAYILSYYKSNAYHVRCVRGQEIRSAVFS